MIGETLSRFHVTALSKSFKRWALVGWLGLTPTLLVLTFFSVIAGWALAYLFKAATAALSSLDARSATATFETLLADPASMMVWSGVILALLSILASKVPQYCGSSLF